VASRDFYRRPFNAFFSYSHADRERASEIVAWLERAGVKAWFDRTRLDSGRPVATTLQRQLGDCRSLIVLVTPASLRSNWVEQEWTEGREESARNSAFKTILLVSAEVKEIPRAFESRTWVSLAANGLDVESAARILASLYDGDGKEVMADDPRDVFITRSWRESETVATDRLCSRFVNAGFRLIGDMPDQDSFSKERIATIMSTCGVHLAVLPNRPAGDEGLRFMLDEVEIARECGLDSTIIAHTGLSLSLPAHQLDIDGNDTDSRVLEPILEELQRRYRRPRKPHFVLFTTQFSEFNESLRHAMNRVIARVTTRRCVFTDEITNEARLSFTDRVKGAAALIADVADNQLDPWVLAGFARGAATPVHVIARASTPQPRLFRDKVRYYANDVERVGLVHELAFQYRRRLLDFEVAGPFQA
jgi:hypothetical protein